MADKESLEIANSTHCRCGLMWGEHCNNLELQIKNNCVSCGSTFSRRIPKKGKYGEVTYTEVSIQTEARYKDKGNYCDKCNNKCTKQPRIHSKSDQDFFLLFKNKQK